MQMTFFCSFYLPLFPVVCWTYIFVSDCMPNIQWKTFKVIPSGPRKIVDIKRSDMYTKTSYCKLLPNSVVWRCIIVTLSVAVCRSVSSVLLDLISLYAYLRQSAGLILPVCMSVCYSMRLILTYTYYTTIFW